MEERNELVRCLATLWKKHKERELLYLTAMKIADIGNLRKTFSQGYMIALLFQKEINAMYDSLRCSLDDASLCKSCTKHLTQQIHRISTNQDVSLILSQLESETLTCYEEAYRHIEIYLEEAQLINEHISRLQELRAVLLQECPTTLQVTHTNRLQAA